MTTPVRVAAYVVALVAVFAAALGVGRVAGPEDVAAAPAPHEPGSAHSGEGTAEGEAHDAAAHEEGAAPAAHVPGGLMVSAEGHTLELADTTLPAGRAVPLRFRVLGPDGAPVTAYDVEHEKELHLIVVRRDFRGFQHVHPTRADDGTWSVDVALQPGTWRVLADFTPTGGEGMTLGADVAVAGPFRPAAPVTEQRRDTVDGYTVTMSGELTAGSASDVTLVVRRDGQKVTDLEPYLGAYGHLVALREGDLAYLHVHPDDAGPGPRVPFVAEVPSEGRYRLFFDFQHAGVVRTASFVVDTTGHDGDAHDATAEEGESHDH